MYPVGLSVSSLRITEEMFQNMANAGVAAMEVSHSLKKHLEADNLPQFAAWAKQYGVDLWSYHLPFWDDELKFDISDVPTADATVKLFCSIIEQGVEAGIKRFIIHPSTEPISDEDRPGHMERSKKSLYMLAEFAKTKGAVMCVENLPRTCLGKNSAEMLELLSAHPDLRVCFDTNHLLQEPFVDFIHAVGDKIATLHVSDYDYIDEKHWFPGEGLVDWHLLYSTLKEVGYDGVWMYETGIGDPKNRRTRKLTCEDVAQNAKEIFERKPITSYLIEKLV